MSEIPHVQKFKSLIQPFAHKIQKETSWDLRLFQCTWTIQHNGTFAALEILLTTWDGQKKNVYIKIRKEDKRYATGTNLNWLARFLNHQQDSQCFKKETHPPTSCSTGWKSLEKMTRKAVNIDGCQGWDHWDYNELSCSDLNWKQTVQSKFHIFHLIFHLIWRTIENRKMFRCKSLKKKSRISGSLSFSRGPGGDFCRKSHEAEMLQGSLFTNFGQTEIAEFRLPSAIQQDLGNGM